MSPHGSSEPIGGMMLRELLKPTSDATVRSRATSPGRESASTTCPGKAAMSTPASTSVKASAGSAMRARLNGLGGVGQGEYAVGRRFWYPDVLKQWHPSRRWADTPLCLIYARSSEPLYDRLL